jgi:hypothetical protein
MSEAVKVVIIEKEGWNFSTPKYEVFVKPSREFMMEPKEIISDEEKSEYISQRIK